MVDLIFRINTGGGYQTVDPPRNWTEMKVQLVFDKEQLQLQLQSINFEWVLSNAKLLKDYYDAGLTGGPGVMEGPGLQIFGQIPGGVPYQFFDGCINTADRGFMIQDDIIMCPIKESGKTDWFHTESESFYFHYLASLPAGTPGSIQRSDYKQVPYAISSIPDYTQAMLLSISLFIMVKESVDCVCKIVSLTVEAISQSLSWLQLVGTILQIVLYLIYLVAIITASAKLIQEICDNLLQPKKTKLGMRSLDLWIKMAEYMGLNFVSPIYGYGTADLYGGRYVNATLLPKKTTQPVGDPNVLDSLFKRPADETSNPESYGYFEGTGSDFVKQEELTYNAKAIVRGNTLYFQEKNSYDIADAFRLPNEGKVGNTFLYPQPFSTNASEIPANYSIRMQKDDQDLNTYKDYTGTMVLAQTTPLVVNNPKHKLMGGSVKVELPFAKACRKVGLTKLEQSLAGLIDQFAAMLSGITNSVNHATSQMSGFMPGVMSAEDLGMSNTQVGFVVSMLLGNPAGGVIALIFGSDGLPILPTVTIPYFSNDRIGWMLLSSDYTGQQKRFIGTPNGADWFIDPNNSSGTFVSTIPPTSITGTFTGTYSGLGFSSAAFPPCSVVGGIITVNIPTGILGPAIVVVSGTISGQGSTIFTAVISGTAGGGNFTGVATINVGAAYSTYDTQGYGSMGQLYADFHVNNMISHNQWLIFDNKTFKFSMRDFVKVSEKNVLIAPTGEEGKFQQLMWKLHDDLVDDVDYRVKHKYTNNYQITVSTDVG